MCKNFTNGLLNKKVLESLILSGACDSLPGNRAQCFEVIDLAIKFGQDFQNQTNSNQASLFGKKEIEIVIEPSLPDIAEWKANEKLAKEKETLGLYITGDPLEDYNNDIKEFSKNLNNNLPKTHQKDLRTGGIITDLRLKYDKNNNPWAIVDIANNSIKTEAFVFSSTYIKYKHLIEKDGLVFIKGKPSNRNYSDDIIKIIVDEIIPLKNIRSTLSNNINIKIDNEINNQQVLSKIKTLAKNNKGNCALVLHFEHGHVSKKIKAGKITVSYSQKFITELREIIGDSNVWIN
jgi:DNA polymerase-3 subunit alpha